MHLSDSDETNMRDKRPADETLTSEDARLAEAIARASQPNPSQAASHRSIAAPKP